MHVNIERLEIENAETVFELVQHLLRELGDEEADLGTLNKPAVVKAWTESSEKIFTFAAKSDDGATIGLATVVEAFAIYANGSYGIINEMYVDPAYRSEGIGHQLVLSIRKLAGQRGWSRIDVTAPESEGWERTRAFYEREGFSFTGPKLKLALR